MYKRQVLAAAEVLVCFGFPAEPSEVAWAKVIVHLLQKQRRAIGAE